MPTTFEKEAWIEACSQVRDDKTDINWAALKHDGNNIVPAGQGVDYEEVKSMCTDDAVLFIYLRVMTGDAMSKRAKFTLITWIGESLGGLKRAKISIDKTLVKGAVQSYAKEFQLSDPKELEEDYIRDELKKAGGANYDAQTE